MLAKAKRNFDLAIAAKSGHSDRSRQLRGEAWLKRGFLEAHCGESKSSDLCFANAITEWKPLNNGKYLVNKIDVVKHKIKLGIRPNVECPSQLSLAPSVAMISEDDAPDTVQAAPIPPSAFETSMRETNVTLTSLTTALLETMNQLILELRSDRETEAIALGTTPPSAPTPVEPTRPDTAMPDPGPAEPSIYERQITSAVEFQLVNTTNAYQTVQIEGIQRRYRLAPGQQVSFTVNNGPLTLIRVNRRRKVKFSADIFWDSANGRPKVPLIEITNCCFREIKPGGAEIAGEKFTGL